MPITDLKAEEDGDFEPMKIFQNLPELTAPTSKRSILDTLRGREMDEDQDMSEFIMTQGSVASIVSSCQML